MSASSKHRTLAISYDGGMRCPSTGLTTNWIPVYGTFFTHGSVGSAVFIASKVTFAKGAAFAYSGLSFVDFLVPGGTVDHVEGDDPAEAHRQSLNAEKWRAALRHHGCIRQICGWRRLGLPRPGDHLIICHCACPPLPWHIRAKILSNLFRMNLIKSNVDLNIIRVWVRARSGMAGR